MAGEFRYPDPDVKEAWARFWALIDSENVRAFVWPYYFAFITWGIYGTFFAAPVTIVEPVMGHMVYDFWIWLCVAGPASVMAGLLLGPMYGWMRKLVSRTTRTLARRGLLRRIPRRLMRWTGEHVTREAGEYLGLWMQIGGNACVGVLLFAFEFSGLKGAYWGQAAFSLFLVPPYILGCITLTLQAARKVYKIELVQRAIGKQ